MFSVSIIFFTSSLYSSISFVNLLYLSSLVKYITFSHLFLNHCSSFNILFLYAVEVLYSIISVALIIFVSISLFRVVI